MTTAGETDEGLRVEAREEGPVTRSVEIELPVARVAAAFRRSYRELARSARVRGFRPGKAPASVLRRLYGAAVAEDVERDLVSATLASALERSGIVPVSEPAIDASPPREDASFVYRARVEVKPPVVLGDVNGLSARRPSTEVSEEDIDRELETLRQRHSSLVEEAEDVPAAKGHFLTLDFEGRVDGQAFEGGSGKETTVELGSEQLVPGFEEQLVGARAGEERRVRVRFPEDYGHAGLAGKDAEFDVRVLSIRRREVPALDDEFAKDLGDFESLDAVRTRIRESLAASRERRSRSELRRSLLDALIERTPFEVPPGLVRDRLQRRLHSAAHELSERQVGRSLAERQLAQWEEEWRPAVEREIREEWILEAVARQQEIAVDDAEFEERLARLAEAQGEEPARLRKAYREAELFEPLRARFLEDKAVEFLASLATVEEVPAS